MDGKSGRALKVGGLAGVALAAGVGAYLVFKPTTIQNTTTTTTLPPPASGGQGAAADLSITSVSVAVGG